MEDRQPLIYGLDSVPLPATYTPLEAIVAIKCLDDEGDVVICTRRTLGLKIWDSVGMLTVALDLDRREAVECFSPDANEEGDSDA